MSCPDELTLDLWLADALTPAEATGVAAHVAACPTCSALREQWHATDTSLRAALDLDEDERAYLVGLNLASTWRAQSALATDRTWGWLALFTVLAGFVAWTVAAQPIGQALSALSMVGASTLLLTTAIGLVLHVGRSAIELSTNPALGVIQPLLGMLALGLLFWPRLTKVGPHFGEGVRS